MDIKFIGQKNSDSRKIFISTKIKKINAWTSEEDEILLSHAEKYGYRQWKKIAQNFNNRSSVQCSARYKRIRPGLVKGNWSKDEDKVVMKLVDKYGRNWSLLSKYIPTRTGKQIRDRFLNSLDSNINRDKFSVEEDEMIIQMYLQYGTKWSVIAKFFKKRTGDMIKNRFYSTLRKKIHDYGKQMPLQKRRNLRIRKIRNPCKMIKSMINKSFIEQKSEILSKIMDDVKSSLIINNTYDLSRPTFSTDQKNFLYNLFIKNPFSMQNVPQLQLKEFNCNQIHNNHNNLLNDQRNFNFNNLIQKQIEFSLSQNIANCLNLSNHYLNTLYSLIDYSPKINGTATY